MPTRSRRQRDQTHAIAARMRTLLAEDPGRYWWSKSKWVTLLGCTPWVVSLTSTWKVEIREWRVKAQATGDRPKDRRLAMNDRVRKQV
jgi:hypothetical protein